MVGQRVGKTNFWIRDAVVTGEKCLPLLAEELTK